MYAFPLLTDEQDVRLRKGKEPGEWLILVGRHDQLVALCNLRGLLELKVPEALPRSGSISAKNLAKNVGAEQALIGR
jgi:hypothetical protein